MDKSGQRSRGFGYGLYETEQGAQQALTALNGQELKGRRVSCVCANQLTNQSTHVIHCQCLLGRKRYVNATARAVVANASTDAK